MILHLFISLSGYDFGGKSLRSQCNRSNRGSFAILQNQLRLTFERWKAYLRANRYLGPNFSNSARTQSVIVGIPSHQLSTLCGKRADIHLAIKQSIIPCTNSILFWIEKLMKFVSTSTRYGGPRSVLCDKNNLSLVSLIVMQAEALRRWYLLPESLAQSYEESREETYTCFLSSMILSFSAFFAAFSTFSFLSLSSRYACQVKTAYNLGSLGLIIRFTAANLRVCFAFPWGISSYISHLAGRVMVVYPSILVARLTILSILLQAMYGIYELDSSNRRTK